MKMSGIYFAFFLHNLLRKNCFWKICITFDLTYIILSYLILTYIFFQSYEPQQQWISYKLSFDAESIIDSSS